MDSLAKASLTNILMEKPEVYSPRSRRRRRGSTSRSSYVTHLGRAVRPYTVWSHPRLSPSNYSGALGTLAPPEKQYKIRNKSK